MRRRRKLSWKINTWGWSGIDLFGKSRGCEIAFGHHRLEAARRLGIGKVPLITDDLSNQQMLQFMGRENGEDYSAEFLVMLNTWGRRHKFPWKIKAEGQS